MVALHCDHEASHTLHRAAPRSPKHRRCTAISGYPVMLGTWTSSTPMSLRSDTPAGAYAHDVHAHRCEAPLDGRKPRGPGEPLGFGRRDLLDGASEGRGEPRFDLHHHQGVTLARQDVHLAACQLQVPPQDLKPRGLKMLGSQRLAQRPRPIASPGFPYTTSTTGNCHVNHHSAKEC